VEFETGTDSDIPDQTVPARGLVKRPPDPTDSERIFVGWFKDKDFEYPWDFDTKVTDDMTLYAKWTREQQTHYTVTFDSNGGSSVPKQTVYPGDTVMRPTPAPTRPDYTFDGWYKDSPSVLWDFDAKVTGDMTLHAKWTREQQTLYTVTFDSNGGTSVEEQLVPYGGTVERPADPVDPSNSGDIFFDGWYEDEECEELWDFENDRVYEDITLYAGWVYDDDKSGGGDGCDTFGLGLGRGIFALA
jgi:uncharacterized repeat protein (TIGR02543 family)